MAGQTSTVIARGLTRRRALRGGISALVASPCIIRSGLAQSANINVGVIQPLTGANSQFGVNCRNGIEFAADAINAAGGIKALGGAKVNLVVADATSNPAAAVAVTKRLISENDLTAVLGAFVSSLSLAISEITARADIPFLTVSFADEITGRGLESVFQIPAKASVIGRAQVNYTLAIAEGAGKKIDKIAIMYEDTAYGVAQSRGLRIAARVAGVAVVMDEAYPPGVTSVTSLVEKLRASGAQAVFPVSYLNDGLFIVRTMRQQKIQIPVVGGAAGYTIPDFEKGLGDFAEDVLSISPANYDFAPSMTEQFRKRFGFFMMQEAIGSAASLDVLCQAMERAKSAKPKDVTASLHDGRFDAGWAQAEPGGAVQFDEAGLNTISVPIMVQWQKRELVTVWPKEIAKVAPVWHSQ